MSPHNRLCLSKGGFLETSRFSSSIPLQEFLCPTAHEAHKRSQSFKQYSFLNRLIFLFVSGQELGRHSGREGRKECLLCDAECESVSHVLWDCPAYVSIRSAFMLELRRELGDRFEHFQSLDSFEKSSY